VQIVKPVVATALAALVSACSVSAPLSLESTGTIRETSESVFIAMSTEDATPNRATFGGALIKAFAQNSFSTSDEGNLIVDFGVSISDAKTGLIGGEVQTGKPDQDQTWLAAARSDRDFDKCDAQRMRGTLVLIDRTTGTTLYRGSATRVECNFSDRDLETMAEALVEDAISVRSPSPAA
jgi:hypothetical protein